MSIRSFRRPSILLLGLALAGCASSERAATKGDLFSDPSKFESLASNAYPFEATAPVAAAPAPISPLAPVETVAAQPALASPAPLLDGASLISSPPSVANRAPAAVIFPKPDSESAPAAVPASPDAAYAELIRGNERFAADLVKGERRDSVRRRSLAAGEKPFAVVLSCSDSRVPPELIFDQGLGDLLSIRVAGNVLGSAQVASIEDAVQNLGAKLILVMGHESCGAVRAAIAPTAKHASGASPDLDWLASAIRPNLKERGIASVSADDPKLRKPVMANIDAVTESLTVRSRIIGDAIVMGKLKVVRGIYSLDTGRVDFWGSK